MNKFHKKEQKLDILFICNSLDLGGAERIMYEIAKDITLYKKEIICLTGKGYYSKLLENEGIKITYCNLQKNLFDFLKIFKLYRFILTKKPKVIHSFLYHSDVIASILGKLTFTKKILWSIHHDFIKSDNTFLRNMQVRFLSIISNFLPNKIIYCSKESLENHVKIGYSKNKSVVINNGICTKKFNARKKIYFKIRKLLGIKNDSFLIGHIARFHPNKGHNTLLKCLKLLKQEHENFICLMIGTNVDKKNIELNKKIRNNNLEDNIILYGETKFPQKLINAFDINIISSNSESSPLVLLEAMASGVPTLATNVGEIKNIMGKTGWIVKNKSSKELAEKLKFIIKNKDSLKAKSLLTRKIISKKYSQSEMLKKYNLTYNLYF